MTEWRRKNPERQTENNRAYQRANAASRNARNRERYASDVATMRVRRQQRHLRAKYDLTEAEYAALLEVQGGVCAICHQPETSVGRGGKVRRLAVDHDHRTGRIRGLLCLACNRTLGYARDDAAILLAAAKYLS